MSRHRKWNKEAAQEKLTLYLFNSTYLQAAKYKKCTDQNSRRFSSECGIFIDQSGLICQIFLMDVKKSWSRSDAKG